MTDYKRPGVLIEIGKLSDVPWSRYEWTGSFIAVDDCPTTDLTEEDVAVVLAYGSTPDGWDGTSAGVVLLRDGRVIAWESNWGPTGSGFCCDAYGGDADIVCSWTIEGALRRISEQSRELLSWPHAVADNRATVDHHLSVALDAQASGRSADAERIRGMAIAVARGHQ